MKGSGVRVPASALSPPRQEGIDHAKLQPLALSPKEAAPRGELHRAFTRSVRDGNGTVTAP
jgi:hypothetical protein